MKYKLQSTLLASGLMAMSIGSAQAITLTYTGTAGGDVEVDTNWSDSGLLPTGANDGTVTGVNTVWSSKTLEDYHMSFTGTDTTQITFTRTNTVAPIFLDLTISLEYATMVNNINSKHFQIRGASDFIVNTGGIIQGHPGKNFQFQVGAGQIFVNGGTITGETLEVAADNAGGDYGFVIMGAGNGLVDLDSKPIFSSADTPYIDFLSGSGGTLDITEDSADLAYYSGLWDAGHLRVDGVKSGAFADHFEVNGTQLSLVVPEPSSTALLGLGGLALILRRRK